VDRHGGFKSDFIANKDSSDFYIQYNIYLSDLIRDLRERDCLQLLDCEKTRRRRLNHGVADWDVAKQPMCVTVLYILCQCFVVLQMPADTQTIVPYARHKVEMAGEIQ